MSMEGTNIKFIFIMLAIVLVIIGAVMVISNRPIVFKDTLVFYTQDNIKYRCKVKVYLKKYSKYKRYTVIGKQRRVNSIIAKELKRIHSSKISNYKFRQNLFKQYKLVNKVQELFSIATVTLIRIKKIRIYRIKRDYSSRSAPTSRSYSRREQQNNRTTETSNSRENTTTETQSDSNK